VPGTVEERVALALAALAEVTDPADVGALLEAEVVEPGVVDLRFACTLPGYAAWRWTVSTTDLPDLEPTVLEVELLPGDDALLAPPWVPWTERLAEWRRQHPDEQHADDGSAEDEAGADDVDTDDEDAELDEDDLGVDDELDELDETQLDAADRAGDDDEDDADEDDDSEDVDDDESDDEDADDDGFDGEDPSTGSGRRARGPRPGDEDRSL
jgi:hypothetical protein